MIITKSVLSALFMVAAIVQPHPDSRYYYFVLVGLALCLCGDVFLALPYERAFLFGLVSFLLGHILYIFGFFHAAHVGLWTWFGSAGIILVSSGIFFWLRPHLGPMKLPVLIYVAVISIMMAGAFSVLGDLRLALPGRIMVFAGALSFYFSDVFVARDRFMKKDLSNRIIGLPMYYTGQFLLAFSVGVLA